MGKKKPKIKSKEEIIPQKAPCLNNLAVTLIIFLLIFTAYKLQPSYKWVYDSLARSNVKTIKDYPKLPINKKYEAKLGFDYRYINYVKINTPKNAVILMPPHSEFIKKNFNKKGAWGAKNKCWNTYFLYPRVVIDQKTFESDTTLASLITHVMIVNGWGYDNLTYFVPQKSEYNVLPIKLSGVKK